MSMVEPVLSEANLVWLLDKLWQLRHNLASVVATHKKNMDELAADLFNEDQEGARLVEEVGVTFRDNLIDSCKRTERFICYVCEMLEWFNENYSVAVSYTYVPMDDYEADGELVDADKDLVITKTVSTEYGMRYSLVDRTGSFASYDEDDGGEKDGGV